MINKVIACQFFYTLQTSYGVIVLKEEETEVAEGGRERCEQVRRK